jgi:hypothetical protein
MAPTLANPILLNTSINATLLQPPQPWWTSTTHINYPVIGNVTITPFSESEIFFFKILGLALIVSALYLIIFAFALHYKNPAIFFGFRKYLNSLTIKWFELLKWILIISAISFVEKNNNNILLEYIYIRNIYFYHFIFLIL